jgi:predicted permease
MTFRRRRRRSDDDFAAEIESHLESETARLVGEGLTEQEARSRARRSFGNVTRARENFHERQHFVWPGQLAQDLRYAWRGLWYSRAFLATTVVTLAVGMSLVSVVFGVFNAYVLRPFAVHDPYSLYAVGWRAQEAAGSSFRMQDYEDLQGRSDIFEGVIAETTRSVVSNNRALAVGFVSGNYFTMLGVRMRLGRGVSSSDAAVPGSEAVAVLSEQAWATLFDRDPLILGRTIDLGGQDLVIIGVASGTFAGLDQAPKDAWVPITMYGPLGGQDLFAAPQKRQVQITARLRHDRFAQEAQTSLAFEPFETRISGRLDAVRATLEQRATPVRMSASGYALLSPVFAAFGLVLLAACANASNVMLARANARHREIGIRLSIGASRGRVVRQLLTEGFLISVLAAGLGLVLAQVFLRVGVFALLEMLPPTIASRARIVPLDLDIRVLGFAGTVAAGVTILFALLPALQATRLSLTDALRGHVGAVVRSSTLRYLLGICQVAVSLVLVLVASTLVRNGVAIRSTDLGMATDHVVSVRPGRGEKTLLARTHAALAADPRLGQVAVASRSPLFGDPPRIPLRQPAGIVLSAYTFVSPEYFPILNIPIVHGRGFSNEESRTEASVAIISVAGARALWPGEEPIGQTIRLSIEPPTERVVAETVQMLRRVADDDPRAISFTIVGVAKDVVSGFVYQGTDASHVYLPTSATGSRARALLVRRAAGTSMDGLKAALQGVHNDLLSFDVLPVDEMVALQMFPLRAASWIGALLSAIALALSVSGLYGVLTYTFGQRTREIGIRIALGASARTISRLVFDYSLRLGGAGLLIGLVAGFIVMKVLSTFVRLDNVSVLDPAAFVLSVVVIAMALGIASVGPARRASRISPSEMLRDDA